MADILSEYFFPAVRLIEKEPSAAELVPVLLPSTSTEAPGMGSFLSLKILPESLAVCAVAAEKINVETVKKTSRNNMIYLFAAKVQPEHYLYVTAMLSNCNLNVTQILRRSESEL